MPTSPQRPDSSQFFPESAPDGVTVAKHAGSLLFNQKTYEGYSEIEQGLFLGQLPTKDLADRLASEHLQRLPVVRGSLSRGLVVSCNEMFELAGIGSSEPVVTPNDWAQVGVKHHHLPFVDFSADANPSVIINALAAMQEARQDGTPIYVHCKAGRARSAILTALHLCLNALNQQVVDSLSPLAAEDLTAALDARLKAQISEIKKKRDHITVSDDKRELGVATLTALIKGNRLSFDARGSIVIAPDFRGANNTFEQNALVKLVQKTAFKDFMIELQRSMPTKSLAGMKVDRLENLKKFFALIVKDPTVAHAVLTETLATRRYDDAEPHAMQKKALLDFMNSTPLNERVESTMHAASEAVTSLLTFIHSIPDAFAIVQDNLLAPPAAPAAVVAPVDHREHRVQLLKNLQDTMSDAIRENSSAVRNADTAARAAREAAAVPAPIAPRRP